VTAAVTTPPLKLNLRLNGQHLFDLSQRLDQALPTHLDVIPAHPVPQPVLVCMTMTPPIALKNGEAEPCLRWPQIQPQYTRASLKIVANGQSFLQ
jgi:hypothetical protein